MVSDVASVYHVIAVCLSWALLQPPTSQVPSRQGRKGFRLPLSRGEIDLHPHLSGQSVHLLVQLLVGDAALGDVHQHDHGEHALQDALGDVLDVDVQLTAKARDAGDDAHGVVADDGNECFHNSYPFCYSVRPLRHGCAVRAGLPSYNLSVCFADSSSGRGASGEEKKLYEMPRPPLGRGGGAAAAATERFSQV